MKAIIDALTSRIPFGDDYINLTKRRYLKQKSESDSSDSYWAEFDRANENCKKSYESKKI